MKRLLALMLLVGAMTGLLGAQTAAALSPGQMTTAASGQSGAAADHAMAGMDCAGMGMAATPKAPAPDPSQPCKGLTLACIAAMGCVAPLVAPAALPMFAGHLIPPAKPFVLAGVPLVGRSVGPEPEPPNPLI